MSTLAKCAPIIQLEQFLATCREPEPPSLEHIWTPGLVCRIMTIKAAPKPYNFVCTSKEHKTTHQYTLASGVAKVWEEDKGWFVIQSPHHGITKAGTSRAVIAMTDLVWITHHSTSATTVAELEEELFEPHAIPKRREGLCLA
jgi:hypothetical protein